MLAKTAGSSNAMNTTTRKNNADETDTTIKDVDDAIVQALQELQALKQQREKRQQELQQTVQQWKQVQQSYASQLNSSPRNLYTNIIKSVYNNDVDSDFDDSLPPLYVLQQQATLLLAMHSNFVLLPHQTQLLKEDTRLIKEYLQDEITHLTKEAQQASQQRLSRVSQLAQENHAQFDRYMKTLDSVECQIRNMSLQLPKHSRGEWSENAPTIFSLSSQSDDSSSSIGGEDRNTITEEAVHLVHTGKSKMTVRV